MMQETKSERNGLKKSEIPIYIYNYIYIFNNIHIYIGNCI